MAQAAKAPRQNRTITVDFHDETTYSQLLGDTKAFIECVLAFILSIGFQLQHKSTCDGSGSLTRHAHYARVRLGGLTIWRMQCTRCRAVQTWPRHPCQQWGLKTTGCARVPDRVLTSRTRLGMLCCITYCSDILSPERRHCGHCQPP